MYHGWTGLRACSKCTEVKVRGAGGRYTTTVQTFVKTLKEQDVFLYV